MTGDIDALRAIKEKEESVEAEIRDFAQKQEEMLEQRKSELSASLEAAREEAQRNYLDALEKVRGDVRVKCDEIVESARKEASGMKLKITAAQLEEMVNRLIREYLEE